VKKQCRVTREKKAVKRGRVTREKTIRADVPHDKDRDIGKVHRHRNSRGRSIFADPLAAGNGGLGPFPAAASGPGMTTEREPYLLAFLERLRHSGPITNSFVLTSAVRPAKSSSAGRKWRYGSAEGRFF